MELNHQFGIQVQAPQLALPRFPLPGFVTPRSVMGQGHGKSVTLDQQDLMEPRGCNIYEPVPSSIAGVRVKENQRQLARPYASPLMLMNTGVSAQALP